LEKTGIEKNKGTQSQHNNKCENSKTKEKSLLLSNDN